MSLKITGMVLSILLIITCAVLFFLYKDKIIGNNGNNDNNDDDDDDSDDGDGKIEFNPFFFVPGIVVLEEQDEDNPDIRHKYVDVRMIFPLKTPNRFISLAHNANGEGPDKGDIIANVHKDSSWGTGTDNPPDRYNNFDWRIKYIEDAKSYTIYNLKENSYLSQSLFTSNGTHKRTGENDTSKYFDIEVAQTFNNVKMYRIKTKDKDMSATPYLTFQNDWSVLENSGKNDIYGSVDPVWFSAKKSGKDRDEQSILFANINGPYDIYSNNSLENIDKPFFFVPGLTPQEQNGKKYVEVRMRFDKISATRYISISNVHPDGKTYLTTHTEGSIHFTNHYGNNSAPNFRITYQGFGLGYSIVAISPDINLAQVYNTDQRHPLHTLDSITDSNFDIESVIDTDTSTEYYRILSREKGRKKYLTYGNGWTDGVTSSTEDPVGHGDIDPCYFENELTGTTAKNQYIRFYSTTPPFNVYV